MELHAKQKYNGGFTLIELIISICIIAVLFSLSSLAWGNLQEDSQLDETIADLKSQIAKAQAQSLNNFPGGLYLENNRYTFFYGPVYNPADPKNEITSLPSNLNLTAVNLTNNLLTFDHLTSHPNNYTNSINLSLNIINTLKKKTITINKLGTIDMY